VEGVREGGVIGVEGGGREGGGRESIEWMMNNNDGQPFTTTTTITTRRIGDGDLITRNNNIEEDGNEH